MTRSGRLHSTIKDRSFFAKLLAAETIDDPEVQEVLRGLIAASPEAQKEVRDYVNKRMAEENARLAKRRSGKGKRRATPELEQPSERAPSPGPCPRSVHSETVTQEPGVPHCVNPIQKIRGTGVIFDEAFPKYVPPQNASPAKASNASAKVPSFPRDTPSLTGSAESLALVDPIHEDISTTTPDGIAASGVKRPTAPGTPTDARRARAKRAKSAPP